MTPTRSLPVAARKGLRAPLRTTRLGLVAERLARAFWPLWSILIAALAALMLGAHEALPMGLVWFLAAVVIAGTLWAAWHGLRAFRWPSEAEALARLDATLPGRPIAALADSPAIGATDPASRAMWDAHMVRMAERIRSARAVQPNLRIASRDPFALRYAALLFLAVALLFGSVIRVGTVGQIAPGASGQAVAGGPAWEGWIEPPAHTGRPSLYLADLPEGAVEIPQGSEVQIRLYGSEGDLRVSETVSDGGPGAAPETAPEQSFEIARSGRLAIDGRGGRGWQIEMIADEHPHVEPTAPPERGENGQFQQAFSAADDYGVATGQVRVELDMDRLDRLYGLGTEPDPREPLVLDLPMPISGDRADFDATLVEDFSEHPWANMPVTLTYSVTDDAGQSGSASPYDATLTGLRFFDPLAQAIVEQRRDLLWARANAPRVARTLRAISWHPEDLFSSETLYLRLRVAIRRLEAGMGIAPLSAERQEEIADELWAIANQIEFGDLADARERLERAQDRLSEAMQNGADESEIAELMQELREAMDDYIRQLAENGETMDENQMAEGQMQEMSGDQLQEMLDEIQRLMEEGRMAEAQRLMEQLNQMLQNMQVARGQSGQGSSPGQQAMEGLQDTLRDQQGLSDEAFRELQERYGQQGQQGQQGQSGQGQPGQGQPGQGEPGSEGQPGGEQSLADRQRALRDELSRQLGNLPGAGTEAGRAGREALDDADRAMEGAEEALRGGDNATALDRQAEAMDALREGMRNLGEALAQEQQQSGDGQARAEGDQMGNGQDPLGREAGQGGESGTNERVLGEEDMRRRAEELLGEIRRRAGEQDRPDAELDYLRRLLDRF